MAASAKSERDNAASVLRQALRRLDSLTKEKQINILNRPSLESLCKAELEKDRKLTILVGLLLRQCLW